MFGVKSGASLYICFSGVEEIASDDPTLAPILPGRSSDGRPPSETLAVSVLESLSSLVDSSELPLSSETESTSEDEAELLVTSELSEEQDSSDMV